VNFTSGLECVINGFQTDKVDSLKIIVYTSSID